MDIEGLVLKTGLRKSEVSKFLFPALLHPDKALNAVINGRAKLSADNLARLAALSGVTETDAYAVRKWSGEKSKGVLIFKSEDARAVLSIDTGTTTLSANGKTVTFTTDKNITLKDYILHINTLISKQ